LTALILSDTSDATAPVTVSGSSRCMSPDVDAVLSFDDDFDGIIERIDPADLV
jgi:hypothetical protein